MILHELTQTEAHPAYQQLEISNGNRQYDFLISIVQACLDAQRPFLSTQVIKALNYHAICCLHAYAGEFRPCRVEVGNHVPPEHYRVKALMDDFVNDVNRAWDRVDAVYLTAYVLWRLNYIHPFINGNGRTARAAAYFVLCVKSEGLLPGQVMMPELIRRNREEYIQALVAADESFHAGGLDLTSLHRFLSAVIQQQLASHVEPSQEDSDT